MTMWTFCVSTLCFNKKFFKNELCAAPSSKELTSNEGGRRMSHSPCCKSRDGSDVSGRPRRDGFVPIQRTKRNSSPRKLGFGERGEQKRWVDNNPSRAVGAKARNTKAWHIWEVCEDLRSWSMQVGAGHQEAAHLGPSFAYFIPYSHTHLYNMLAFFWLLQYSLTVEKTFRKHCMLQLS